MSTKHSKIDKLALDTSKEITALLRKTVIKVTQIEGNPSHAAHVIHAVLKTVLCNIAKSSNDPIVMNDFLDSIVSEVKERISSW